MIPNVQPPDEVRPQDEVQWIYDEDPIYMVIDNLFDLLLNPLWIPDIGVDPFFRSLLQVVYIILFFATVWIHYINPKTKLQQQTIGHTA